MTTLIAPDAAQVFARVDTKDTEGFVALFAPSGRITFANGDPIVGHDAIREAHEAFFPSIAALRHEVRNQWVAGADTVVELAVSYERLDGTWVTIPVVSIWTVDESRLIVDYRVFYDVAPVYA